MRSTPGSFAQNLRRPGIVVFILLVLLWLILPFSPQNVKEIRLVLLTIVACAVTFIILRKMEWKAYKEETQGLKTAEAMQLRLKHAQELLSKARGKIRKLERKLERTNVAEPAIATQTTNYSPETQAPVTVIRYNDLKPVPSTAAMSEIASLQNQLANAQEELARFEQSRRDREKSSRERAQLMSELREKNASLTQSLEQANAALGVASSRLQLLEQTVKKALAEFYSVLVKLGIIKSVPDLTNDSGLAFLNSSLAESIGSSIALLRSENSTLCAKLTETKDTAEQLRRRIQEESRQSSNTIRENQRRHEAELKNFSESALLAARLRKLLNTGDVQAFLACIKTSSAKLCAMAFADVTTNNLSQLVALVNGLELDNFLVLEESLTQAIVHHAAMPLFNELKPTLKARLINGINTNSWPAFWAELNPERDAIAVGDALLELCVDPDHLCYDLAPRVLGNLEHRAEVVTRYIAHYEDVNSCRAAGITIKEGHGRADAMHRLAARSIALTNDVKFFLALPSEYGDVILGSLPEQTQLYFVGLWLTCPDSWPQLDNPVLQQLIITLIPKPVAACIVLLSNKFLAGAWEVLDDESLQQYLDDLPEAFIQALFALSLASPDLFQKFKEKRSMRMCLGRVATHIRVALCLREKTPIDQAELIFASSSLQTATRSLHTLAKIKGWDTKERRFFQEYRDAVVYGDTTKLSSEQCACFVKARQELTALIERLPPLMLHTIFSLTAKTGKGSIRSELAFRKIDLLGSLTFWDVTPEGLSQAGVEAHDWYALTALLGAKDEFYGFCRSADNPNSWVKANSDDPFQGVFMRFISSRPKSFLQSFRTNVVQSRASALTAALGR